METYEILDYSYFGTPLYNKEKVLMFDGYYFVDTDELIRYVLRFTKNVVLGSNLELRQ
ncbi:hypothetical protein [Mammaliicoccus sp. E-M24]|uniref:hypothetical protein n=1 Tax=Mammaliicoccus sp. E-M24 TaxID=2898684 RepID=UPI001EFC09A6|nr:hypothetical protein [Mammaliicoccus sp. E-M24]